MNEHAQPPERREILSTARRYRRDGYKVSGPDKSAGRPSFLGDVVPDLIAERDDDKVVIQVKRATMVPGSNDIVELAERVAAQPGWRFELIAVRSPVKIAMPDLTSGGDDVGRLLDNGFPKPAFVMVCAMIENMVAFASVRRSESPNLALRTLVRDMVVHGIIDEDMKRDIDNAIATRDAILRGADAPSPTRGDVAALMKLGLDLQREISALAEG